MKKVFAILLLAVNSVFAQTTGNLINPTGWNNITYTNTQGVSYCCMGGPGPAMNQDTNTIRFAWGYSTTSQIIAINQVLSGTGLQIGGFNYSFGLQNDLNNFAGTRGTLIATANLASSSGKILESWSQDYSNVNTGSNFVTQSGTVNFSNPYALTDVGYFGVAFTGKDQNFWAGYYGPRVRDPQFSLNYTVALPKVDNWSFLTNENGTFTLTKQTEIRYGANGTYLYRMLDAGTYSCSNSQFGQDPLVGVGKSCSVPSEPAPATPPVTASNYSPVTSVVNNTALSTVNSLNNNNQNTQPQQAAVAAASQPAALAPQVAGPDPASQPPQPAAASPQPAAASPQPQQAQQQQQQNPVASSTSGSPSPTPNALQPGPSANPQQQAGGPAQSNNTQAASTKSEKQTTGGVSTAQAMAMYQTLSKATEKLNSQTVAKANDVAQAAVAQTEQTAMSVSAAAVSNSQSIAKDAIQNSTTSSKTTTTTSVMAMASTQSSSSGPVQSVTQNTSSSQKASSSGPVLQNAGPTQAVVNNNVNNGPAPEQSKTTTEQTNTVVTFNKMESPTVPVQQNTNIYSLLPQPNRTSSQQGLSIQSIVETFEMPKPKIDDTKFTEVETPNILFVNLTSRTNPVSEYVERNTQFQPTNNVEIKNNTVNKDAQDSDLAGGVTIAKMANAPTGFTDYTNFTMRDVAFYEPKEVYKNQKTIDNARALRQLASDRLHKEMVEQQYRGN